MAVRDTMQMIVSRGNPNLEPNNISPTDHCVIGFPLEKAVERSLYLHPA
jgi:hypothetical protein